MRIRVRSMAVIMTALASFACGGSSAAPPATTSSSPTPAASTATAATPAIAEFGVAECDDYFKKYLACVDKMAPAAQGAARQALEQSRTAWKQAAASDQGKAMLATTCKAASDAAAPGMRAQGCSW